MNFTASLHPEPLAAACNFTKAKPHRGENRYQAVNSLSETYLQTHMQNFFYQDDLEHRRMSDGGQKPGVPLVKAHSADAREQVFRRPRADMMEYFATGTTCNKGLNSAEYYMPAYAHSSTREMDRMTCNM